MKAIELIVDGAITISIIRMVQLEQDVLISKIAHGIVEICLILINAVKDSCAIKLKDIVNMIKEEKDLEVIKLAHNIAIQHHHHLQHIFAIQQLAFARHVTQKMLLLVTKIERKPVKTAKSHLVQPQTPFHATELMLRIQFVRNAKKEIKVVHHMLKHVPHVLHQQSFLNVMKKQSNVKLIHRDSRKKFVMKTVLILHLSIFLETGEV